MDVCLRARENGVRTIYHPQLRLVHTGRHSLESEPYVQLARNRHEVLHSRMDDAAQLLTFATRAAIKRPNDKERAQLSALLEVLRS
jgi:GT2 family glycosyltransferase